MLDVDGIDHFYKCNHLMPLHSKGLTSHLSHNASCKRPVFAGNRLPSKLAITNRKYTKTDNWLTMMQVIDFIQTFAWVCNFWSATQMSFLNYKILHL